MSSQRYTQIMSADENLSPKQWFHGTNQELGDTLDPSQDYTRAHRESLPGTAYFTSDVRRAKFYADWAAQRHGGSPRVYNVEPTGHYHQDFQTRRAPENQQTKAALKVLGEYTE